MSAKIDWISVSDIKTDDQFAKMLNSLPVELWNAKAYHGMTLLHYACMKHYKLSVVTLLKSKRINVNVGSNNGFTPIHLALMDGNIEILELLCASNADIINGTKYLKSPLEYALCRNDEISIWILLANGARLSKVRPHYISDISPAIRNFEQGVLRCRQAVISILRVKRAGNLWQWDKYLLREIAFAIWATRHSADEWI